MNRLTTLLLVTLLSACSTMSVSGPSGSKGKLIDGVKPADFHFGAMSIGQAKDVDHARAEGLGLVPVAAFDAYLNGILSKLLEQSPVRNVPARVYVRASDEWAAITTADANIYVTLGMLLRLDNEDEVAALLGHEVSHAILGHPNSDIVQDVQQRAVQLSGIALATRDLVERGSQGSTRAGPNDAHAKEQGKALLVNTLVVGPAWNREQERAADLLGTDLMVRAGYSPQAVLSLLQKLAEDEGHRANDPRAQYLEQCLSGLGIRDIQQARDYSEQVGNQPGAQNPLLGAAMKLGLDQLMGWRAKKLDEAQRSHPTAAERLAAAQAYIAREYADTAATATHVESWEAAKDRSETADVLENYIAAIQALHRVFEGDLKSARKLSKESLTGATRRHAYPNYVAAAVQVASGDARAALKNYEAALAGPEPAGEILIQASTLYLKAGKRDKATALIESAYRRLQEPPALVGPLIHTYRSVGKQDDADRLAAECAVRWPKLATECSQEAKGDRNSTTGS